MTRLIAISVLTLLLTACALPPQGGGRHAIGGAAPAGAPHPAIDVSPAVRLDLAPGGRLKAAINFGNPILAQRDPATGEPRGVSVDLARELGRRLGVPVDLVLFDSAGRVSAAARTSAWDIAFLAVDPGRAGEIAFSPPYVVIEGAYLVRESSPIRSNDQVDQPGVRVVVGRGSAYDLYLSREIRRATLVHADTSPAVTDRMMAQGIEVAAGVKQQLQADSRRHPGTRLLPESFMSIHQAMGTPRGRLAGADYLNQFVEAMKAEGFVAASLRRHGIEGASIAPAAR
ncbi:MAG TPA: ABC transporter substrate-binding protein [Burkholderiaceae bacterium]|nr:ABC transporter substrate-binding protein [Burkholderiaceae bacterium]